MEIKSSFVADSCICKQIKLKKGCFFLENKLNSIRSLPPTHLCKLPHKYETCPSIDSAGTTSPINPSSELLRQGGLFSLAAREMLNSCAYPSPPAPGFTDVDTVAALISPVTHIHTNAARLVLFLFCKRRARCFMNSLLIFRVLPWEEEFIS